MVVEGTLAPVGVVEGTLAPVVDMALRDFKVKKAHAS